MDGHFDGFFMAEEVADLGLVKVSLGQERPIHQSDKDIPAESLIARSHINEADP